MDAKYQIYYPDYPGFKWAKVSKDDKTENVVLANIIASMRSSSPVERIIRTLLEICSTRLTKPTRTGGSG